MSINPVSSCPTWCDPRVHVDHKNAKTGEPMGSCEHRTAGVTFTPSVTFDNTVTVCAVQQQEDSSAASLGSLLVLLHLFDESSEYHDGTPIEFGIELDPIDAEMLAATLVMEAAKVRALRTKAVAR